MSLSREEEYFIKITKIVVDIFPKYLRKLFIDKWDQKYEYNRWQSDIASGNFLFNKIPNDAKKGRNRVYAINLKSGKESDWDTSTLVYAMLYSQLNLIPSCRPDGQRSAPLLISEEIDIIRKIRNDIPAHAPSMKCSFRPFLEIISQVHSVAENIFGINAKHEIEDLVKLPISTDVADLLKQQLLIEKNRNDEFEKVLKEMEENMKEMKIDLKEVKDDGKELKREVRDFRGEVKHELRGSKDNLHAAAAAGPTTYRKQAIGEFICLCISQIIHGYDCASFLSFPQLHSMDIIIIILAHNSKSNLS